MAIQLGAARNMSLKTLSGRDFIANMGTTKRRRLSRLAIVGGNIALLVLVSLFIVTNRSASQTVRSSTFNSATSTASSVTSPLDQLSSAQIAFTAAQAAGLPELTAIKNQADSDSLALSVVPNDATAVAKPQIVSTAQKSRQDIKTYITQSGDTVSSVATKFGVTENSIRWSNNISGNTLSAGVKLAIPPVNGIVYTVKAGDTPASLATHFQSDAGQIIDYNDAEISGLSPGEQIIIPNGQIFAPAVSTVSYASYYAGSFSATYGGNGYDYGYCTWYVANRVTVPTNWGNANTWATYAALSGWTVSSVPRPGAIAQTSAGYEGHVAYVEAVSDDGTQIKYSDMNGLAGWGRIGYSDWVPSSHFEHYIYH